MQKSPLYWQLFARQLLTDLLLLPPLAGTWLVFRDSSLINLRLLSLVDPGLRTLTHGGLLMTGISICARPNLDIRGLKFDSKLKFEDHVRSIVSRVLQRITISQSWSLSTNIFRTMKFIFWDTSVLLRCNYAFVLPILYYCSLVWWSAAECYFQLLKPQVYWVVCVALFRVSCRCVICVMFSCVLLLGYNFRWEWWSYQFRFANTGSPF